MVPTIAEIGQEFIDRYPHALVGRMASADEQAGPLVLLNSDLASIVTGTVLYTDQGFAGGLFTGQFDPAKMLAVSAGRLSAARVVGSPDDCTGTETDPSRCRRTPGRCRARAGGRGVETDVDPASLDDITARDCSVDGAARGDHR